MMVMGPVYLVRALFHFLEVPLVVSLDNFYLVDSLEYFHLVESLEYFHLVESIEYFHLVESNLVESIEYFPAQKHSQFQTQNFNIFSVCLLLDHSICCNFLNTIPRRDPVRVIRQPFRSGNGGNTELSLSAVLTFQNRKSTNFGVSPRTGLLAKFTLFLASTLETSPETSSRPTT